MNVVFSMLVALLAMGTALNPMTLRSGISREVSGLGRLYGTTPRFDPTQGQSQFGTRSQWLS